MAVLPARCMSQAFRPLTIGLPGTASAHPSPRGHREATKRSVCMSGAWTGRIDLPQMGREGWSRNWKRFDRVDRHYNVRRPRNDRHGGGFLALASALISADGPSGRTGSAPGAADSTKPCASKAYRMRCAISSSSMSGATGPCLVRNTTRRSPTSGQAAGNIAHDVHAITAQETAVEPTQRGARLRNTRGYRSYSARVGVG